MFLLVSRIFCPKNILQIKISYFIFLYLHFNYIILYYFFMLYYITILNYITFSSYNLVTRSSNSTIFNSIHPNSPILVCLKINPVKPAGEMRRGKEEKAEQDDARISLRRRRTDQSFRFWSSPFPAIATKKEETSVAGEGRVSLIAVRKSVERACSKDVAQAQILIERATALVSLRLSLSLEESSCAMRCAISRHATPHSKYHRVAKHSRNCQTTERTKERDKREEKGTNWQFSLTVQLRERLQRAGIAVHVSWNREKVGVPIKIRIYALISIFDLSIVIHSAMAIFCPGDLDKRV